MPDSRLQAVAHPDNPTPVWLKDMLVNQFSHFHMIMRYKDGRIREYEAWSCDDVDSVHNDYQRHLPYIWMVPEFERQKLTAWGTWAMMKDGHVAECLGGFGHGPMDVPTGRVMGDTTSLFVLELYELWRHTGDEAFVKPLYPSVQRAVAWMIANSAQGDYNLPQRLQTTYDHFGFDRQRAVVYNAHIYLAAMQAAAALAEHFNDVATLAAVANATAHTKMALVDPAKLWNSTSSFFRATDAAGGNQIFTDSLYGQMLSHHHFGNFTLPDGYLTAHLKYEWARNEDSYGMRVLNDPIQEDSVWMNGPPTWAYLQIALGNGTAPTDAAFEPLKRMSENFRTRLGDQWNLRALTQTDTNSVDWQRGAPREQGHYGFMMTMLYMYPLLTGQTENMPAGQLALAPVYRPPYTMPVMLSGCEASITLTDTGNATLTVAFGALNLAAKGLRLHGNAYPNAVSLTAGQSVSWHVPV